jgi:class 3 adenylate cyclase/predicted ATPase
MRGGSLILAGKAMRCSNCNTENPSGKKFCGDCGAALANLCPKCGADNPYGKRFCGECGAPLGAPAAAASVKKSNDPPIRVAETPDAESLEGERKTVAALFADIKGSMDLIEDIDPEEARAIVDPALKLMMDAVHRFDGYIVQSTGDGVFALFGAPVAHEDHPQRSLYAALRMQDEVKRYAEKLRAEKGVNLQVRVGANTGEVVVRSIKTGEGHVEYTPIGHSTSLASRLQALASPGSIAISETVRKLAEGYFALKPLGPARIKGVSEAVNVYEVTGLGPLRTRLQRSAGRGLTKFVGRDREMAAMGNAAELAHAGRGQIVAAMAEAGTGKSRLVFEFKAKHQSGWKVLETFSVSHGKASAYFPVIDLLHNYFKIVGDDDERSRRAKVIGAVLALDRSLEDVLPYLFALLAIVEGEDPLAQMDPQVRKRRTLDAIKRILLRESLNQPLIVIFEDLHWIDDETQAFLNLLADSTGTAKILLLVNYRPEYSHQWGSKTYYTQLRLDPLGKENADEMLTAMVGDSDEIRPLKRLVIERTQGNPFFMEETVQVLLDEGALVREGAAVRLTRPLAELKIPPTVQGILAARIDRLPADEKDLLQTLAVIGKEFQFSLVREVVKKPDDELNRMLGDLQLAEFIYEQPAVGDTEYTFKHALTQEVAYNSVLIERRRVTHKRTADAIEAQFTERLEDHFCELAHHYLLSTDVVRGIRYAQLAAEQALSRSAHEEGSGMLEAALKLLDRHPDSAERLRAELALRTIESTLAFVRYGASSKQRELAINRLCEIGERIGEPDQVARGLVTLVNLCFTRGEATRGLELARRALELAKSAEEEALLSNAGWEFGIVAESCGNLSEALANLEGAMDRGGRFERGVSVGLKNSSAFRVHLAPTLMLLGRVEDAAKIAAEGLARARESGHLFSLGHALCLTGGWLARYRREPEIARICGEESIALSEEHGLAEWLPWGHFSRGWAVAELGRLEEGIAEMESGLTGFRQMGGVPRLQYAIASFARSCAQTGRTQQALEMLDGALAHVEGSGEKVDLAEMLRLKGEVTLLSDASMTAVAEQCFRDSLEVARAQSARWWQLRTTTSLARLLGATNRRDEARAMLAEIYNWFTEGFDLADLKDAKSLLDELGS